jgi:uncharacterized protein
MLEVRPLGVTCNIQCQYCYQNPQRDADNFIQTYDIRRIKEAIEAEGGPFALFGGEPLLLPEADLRELWSWGYSRFGHNAVQTNGTLIRDAHIKMFKEFNVTVGISIDGPEELNDVRWHGTLAGTRDATRRTQEAIKALCSQYVPPSIIVTLHRLNASPERLPRLLEWIADLDRLGLRSIRLHLLESESRQIRERYALSARHNEDALLAIRSLEKSLGSIRFDLFSEMRRMLLGDDRGTSCIWNGCDPYTTAAVRGVEGDGQRTNCGRTNKDGIDFVKSSVPGYERYIALYLTPQDNDGCAGCKFFLMCKGQCPGTAINGDWRNRTEHCEVWKALYGQLEAELLDEGQVPLSVSADRSRIESELLSAWSQGRNLHIADSKVLRDRKPEHPIPRFPAQRELDNLARVIETAISNAD